MRFVKMAVSGLALIAFGTALVGCEGGEGEGFPSFVYAGDLSLQSYRAASELPSEVISSVPCYCGCVNVDPPHASLQDCFFNPGGGYSDHAATCDLCGRIALDVQRAYRDGAALVEIRDQVDSKYGVYGSPTDTPPVREEG